MDCSPPVSSTHGIFQARILEWVAISFSRGSFWPRDHTWVPHCRKTLYHLNHQGSLKAMGYHLKRTLESGFHALHSSEQTGAFLFFLSCVQLFATPWTIQTMEFSRPEYWSGWPFPSPEESSQPRDWTQVSRIAGGFFTSWATREALPVFNSYQYTGTTVNLGINFY